MRTHCLTLVNISKVIEMFGHGSMAVGSRIEQGLWAETKNEANEPVRQRSRKGNIWPGPVAAAPDMLVLTQALTEVGKQLGRPKGSRDQARVLDPFSL